MTPEHAKQLLPIIQAYAEGKTIQIKSCGKWIDDDHNMMFSGGEYRIKPEKQKMWINVFDGPCQMGFSTKAKADKHAKQMEQSGYSTVRKACIEIEYEQGEGL